MPELPVPGAPVPQGSSRNSNDNDAFDTDALLGGPSRWTHSTSETELENGTAYSWRQESSIRRVLSGVFGRETRGAIALGSEDEPQAFEKRKGVSRFAKCWIVFFSMLGVSAVISLIFVFSPEKVDTEDPLSKGYRTGLYDEGVLENPTEVTRGVRPIPCHSHNDYWRQVPLYEALHYGCTGVEADVWHFEGDDELYVGHSTRALRSGRSLTSLYVDPLLNILDRQNPDNLITDTAWRGVYQEERYQSLVLLIDFKTEGHKLWPHVVKRLEPLRAKNYLTYFNGKEIIPGPITVVATGYAPFDIIEANSSYRDVFYDAPMEKFSTHVFATLPNYDLLSLVSWVWANIFGAEERQGITEVTTKAFDATNSYYASTSFSRAFGFPWYGRLSDEQTFMLRKQIQGAHDRGLKARYWSTPAWPKSWRRRVWNTLLLEGVDFLNVDDLKLASTLDY